MQDTRKIKPVNPKGNQPWIFTERTDAEAEAPILWPPDAKSPLIGKVLDIGKGWRQEEKETTGWDGCTASQTPWTRLWEIVKDREARCAAVHGVTKSWTWLSDSTTTTQELLRFLECPEWWVCLFFNFVSIWNDSVQFSSVAQSCPTLCNPMDCSTPGFPVHHQLLELAPAHVHRVGNAIQPSHPLSSLLLPPSIFPSIRVFSNESFLYIKWPSIVVSALASVLLMNIHDWFALGLTGLISLQSKWLSRVFSNTTVQKHQFFGTQLSL